jgi:hypothetical protein
MTASMTERFARDRNKLREHYRGALPICNYHIPKRIDRDYVKGTIAGARGEIEIKGLFKPTPEEEKLYRGLIEEEKLAPDALVDSVEGFKRDAIREVLLVLQEFERQTGRTHEEGAYAGFFGLN